MRRRHFIKVVAGAAATWPLAARARQAAMRVKALGVRISDNLLSLTDEVIE